MQQVKVRKLMNWYKELLEEIRIGKIEHLEEKKESS